MPPFQLSYFLLGCLGGLLPDALRLARNRYKPGFPAYLRQGNFWLGVLLLVGIGGLAAWILSAQSGKDALIFGYAAPQLFSQLVAGAAPERPERIERKAVEKVPFGLLKWWAS